MSQVSPTSALSPPVALITGSGRRRLGNVIAHALAARGMSIALHYHRSQADALATVAELRATGVACEAFAADVAAAEEVDRMLAAVQQRFSRLDVLVTTASIWESLPLEQTTADAVRRHFEVNAFGTFWCAKQAGLMMAAQPSGGAIITIGDWAIDRPYLNHSAYFLSKGAIPALTRALAVELAQRNPRVRVNCIQPGPVMFPPHATEAEQRQMTDATLVKHANCPESVAQAVCFLIDNPFVTGVCLPVDGGRSIFAGEFEQRGNA